MSTVLRIKPPVHISKGYMPCKSVKPSDVGPVKTKAPMRKIERQNWKKTVS